jgi:hypothetical protein
VKLQIEQRNKIKQHETEEVKSLNTKPHYGPEENEEVALYEKQKRAE